MSGNGAARRTRSDLPFYSGMIALGSIYVVLLVAMILADATYTNWGNLIDALASREIRYAIKLSLVTCTIAAILSIWVATPIAYILSRFRFRGQALLDAIVDIPIVLAPLVIGLSLLLLFQWPALHALEDYLDTRWGLGFTYRIPGVILAQFMVACAFTIRAMRATFDEIDPRREQVALTLGCSRGQAFWMVALPEARRGIVVAFTLAWARSLGEFGPILVFGGATRLSTEVASTTIFLELSVGNVEAALAVSLFMIAIAVTVLVIVRAIGHGILRHA